MSKIDLTKAQRDQFLAFSFAAADLLIEADADGKIISTLGASKNLTGHEDKDLRSTHWLEILTPKDQAYLKSSIALGIAGKRSGPFLVELAETGKKALLSAISMPQSDHLHITIGLANELADMIVMDSPAKPTQQLLTRDELTTDFAQKIKDAQSLDKNVSMTLLDLGRSKAYVERIGKNEWQDLQEEIASSIQSVSYEGSSAGKVDDNKYTILHDDNFAIDGLTQQLATLTARKDPTGEGLTPSDKTLKADLSQMSAKAATHSVFYTLQAFEEKGTKLNIETLSAGVEAYIENSAEKISDLKGFIDTKRFDLYFQPIINIGNNELSYYEILSRFSHGNTQDWVLLAEQCGYAKDLDLAVIDKALNYIRYKAGTTSAKFSVNISGQSISDSGFFDKLLYMLEPYDNIHERLSFEITESYQIDDIERVAQHVQALKERGFLIALDDFGAGSSSFDYLQKLDVDIVKIDGQYIRNIKASQKDMAIVKSVTSMCTSLGIKIVAEFIQDLETVKLLRNLGIEYGQGYYYARPRPAPDYVNKSAVAS